MGKSDSLLGISLGMATVISFDGATSSLFNGHAQQQLEVVDSALIALLALIKSLCAVSSCWRRRSALPGRSAGGVVRACERSRRSMDEGEVDAAVRIPCWPARRLKKRRGKS